MFREFKSRLFCLIAVVTSSMCLTAVCPDATAEVILGDVNPVDSAQAGYIEIVFDPVDPFTAESVKFEIAGDSNFGVFGHDLSPTGGFFDAQALLWDLTIDGLVGEISNGLPTVPPPTNLNDDYIRIVNDGTESYFAFASMATEYPVEFENVRIVSEPAATWFAVIGMVLTPFVFRRSF